MSTPNFKTQQLFNLYAATMSYEDEDGEEYFDDFLYENASDFIDTLNDRLKFFTITLEGGYYSGVQTYIKPNTINYSSNYTAADILDCYEYFDGSEVFNYHGVTKYILKRQILAEIKKINNQLLPLLRDYTFRHYAETARFSNGEAVYTLVK